MYGMLPVLDVCAVRAELHSTAGAIFGRRRDYRAHSGAFARDSSYLKRNLMPSNAGERDVYPTVDDTQAGERMVHPSQSAIVSAWRFHFLHTTGAIVPLL